MTAFYNEIDPYAAEWLRNLIAAGHIAPGVVDTRSIEDIAPHELERFTQCHFFAGVGVWSHALRSAGWSDDRPVWTGSCPCQPFSAAGQGLGFADERHLWPHFLHLIGECRPPVVLGEQVAAKAVDAWIDLVCADVEGLGYAFGAVPFPSAGVGAPHIRDRCYWVADGDGGGARLEGRDERTLGLERAAVERGSSPGGLADGHGNDRAGRAGEAHGDRPIESDRRGDVGRLAHDDDAGLGRFAGLRLRGSAFHDADGRGPVRGFWADAEWLPCRDNKWRPVEPGTFPLAHGAPSRVGRLRAYGNAINAEAAHVFIEAYLEGEIA